MHAWGVRRGKRGLLKADMPLANHPLFILACELVTLLSRVFR